MHIDFLHQIIPSPDFHKDPIVSCSLDHSIINKQNMGCIETICTRIPYVLWSYLYNKSRTSTTKTISLEYNWLHQKIHTPNIIQFWLVAYYYLHSQSIWDSFLLHYLPCACRNNSIIVYVLSRHLLLNPNSIMILWCYQA